MITIFVLVFITELVSWIGKSALLEIVHALFLRLFHSSTFARQHALKSSILSTKAELLRTSAQDEFAKWAKLRRNIDKGLADLEQLNAEISSNKTAFSLKFNTLLWISTTGLQFVVGWWFRRSAVFYLPPGWLGPIGWWLALPFAPKGSVSVGVWQMACRRVIKVGEKVVRDLWPAQESEEQKAP